MIRLENVLKIPLQDFLKTSWRCLEDVFARTLEDVLTKSWRCLEDVFWRRMTKANMSVLIKTSWRRLEDVFWRRRRKTSSRRLQNVFIKMNVWWDLCETSWRCLEYVFARRLEDVLKTSSRCLAKTSWRCLKDVLKKSWKCLEDVLARRLENVLKVVFKTSWSRRIYWSWLRRLERLMTEANLFFLMKTSWKRFLKTKTKDVFKTSSRRLHEDEYLLGYNNTSLIKSDQIVSNVDDLCSMLIN